MSGSSSIRPPCAATHVVDHRAVLLGDVLTPDGHHALRPVGHVRQRHVEQALADEVSHKPTRGLEPRTPSLRGAVARPAELRRRGTGRCYRLGSASWSPRYGVDTSLFDRVRDGERRAGPRRAAACAQSSFGRQQRSSSARRAMIAARPASAPQRTSPRARRERRCRLRAAAGRRTQRASRPSGEPVSCARQRAAAAAIASTWKCPAGRASR